MDKRLGIDAEVWSRVAPLLDQALDLPPAERAAWLDALPAADADLRDTLRDLLAREVPFSRTLTCVFVSARCLTMASCGFVTLKAKIDERLPSGVVTSKPMVRRPFCS